MKKFTAQRARSTKEGLFSLSGFEPNEGRMFLSIPLSAEYKENMLSALSIEYYEMTASLSLSKKDSDSSRSEEGFDIEYANLLKTVGNAISYLHNCRSGIDKTLHEFDKHELHNKFLKVINYLK